MLFECDEMSLTELEEYYLKWLKLDRIPMATRITDTIYSTRILRRRVQDDHHPKAFNYIPNIAEPELSSIRLVQSITPFYGNLKACSLSPSLSLPVSS